MVSWTATPPAHPVCLYRVGHEQVQQDSLHSVQQDSLHSAVNLEGPQNLRGKNLYLHTKSVINCHFFVDKGLNDNNFTVRYALLINKCLFVCR